MRRRDTQGLVDLSYTAGLTALWLSIAFVLAVTFPKTALAIFDGFCRIFLIPIMFH